MLVCFSKYEKIIEWIETDEDVYPIDIMTFTVPHNLKTGVLPSQ